MGYASVENKIRAKFVSDVATAASLTVVYDNAPPPSVKQTWARFAISYDDTEQIHGGGVGDRRFRVRGRADVTFYGPVAKGDAALAALIDTTVAAFTASATTSPTVEFTPPPSAVGQPDRDDSWCQRMLTIPFQFDYYA